MLSTDQNPVINQAGTAQISGGQFCTWFTANGSNSNITITNSSRANTLKFAVTGIPAGVIAQLDGKPLSDPNGFFEISPNSPNDAYQAIGDFKGATVTITNVTNTANDATAQITAQTTESRRR